MRRMVRMVDSQTRSINTTTNRMSAHHSANAIFIPEWLLRKKRLANVWIVWW